MSDGRRYSAAECQEYFGVLTGRDYAVLLAVLAGVLLGGVAAGAYVVPDGWLPGDAPAQAVTVAADVDADALVALREQVEAQVEGSAYVVTLAEPALLVTVRDPAADACLDLLVVEAEGEALVAPLGRPYPC